MIGYVILFSIFFIVFVFFLGVFSSELHFKTVAKKHKHLDEEVINFYSVGHANWRSILYAVVLLLINSLVLSLQTHSYVKNVVKDVYDGKYERVVKTTTVIKNGQQVKNDSTITFVRKKP